MSVKAGDRVSCDFGYGPHEHWKECVVLSVNKANGLFGGTTTSLHVKAVDGDTMDAIMWRELEPASAQHTNAAT